MSGISPYSQRAPVFIVSFFSPVFLHSFSFPLSHHHLPESATITFFISFLLSLVFEIVQ